MVELREPIESTFETPILDRDLFDMGSGSDAETKAILLELFSERRTVKVFSYCGEEEVI